MGSAGGPCGEPRGICDPSCGTLSRSRCLWGRMAQDLSEKELLKMEVEQLKKEVKNPRMLVSPLFPSLLLFSIASGSSWSRDPPPRGSDRQWGGEASPAWRAQRAWPGAPRREEVTPHPRLSLSLSPLQPPSPPCPGPVFLDRANHGSPQTNKAWNNPLFSRRFPRQERKSRIMWRLKQETTLSSKASLRTRTPSRRKAVV